VQSEENPIYTGELILTEINCHLIKYSNHIVDLIASSGFTSSLGPILDFGAGQGTLAQILRDKYALSPICVEIDPRLRSVLKKNQFDTYSSIAKSSQIFSLIYTSNVLEHIRNDGEVLAELKPKLIPGGYLTIYVPAFPLLFSALDRNVGHFRRYTKLELRTKVERAGFEVVRIEYSDSLGFFATLLLKILNFSFKTSGGSTILMKIYDKYLVPVSIFFDRVGFKHILGKNLFLVARAQG
jgi:SAM-dependent methyltransferase